MMTTPSTAAASLRRHDLHPYVSFIVLEVDKGATADRTATLMSEIVKIGSKTAGNRDSTVVALADAQDEVLDFFEASATPVSWRAAVVKVNSPATWSSQFSNSSHELVMLVSVGNLIAVHASGSMRDKVKRWVDGPRNAQRFRPIRARVLEGSLLCETVTRVALRGTHPRRGTKADNKQLGAMDIGALLRPGEDDTFVLVSGVGDIPPELADAGLTGAIGTTPHESRVWQGPSESVSDYVRVVAEVLLRLGRALNSPDPDFPLKYLCQEVATVSEAHEAYEVYIADPMLDSPIDDAHHEEREAAVELIRDRITGIRGDGRSPNLNLLFDCGELRCRISRTGKGRLDFPGAENVTDHTRFREIQTAIEAAKDLLSIYYESGHAFVNGAMYRPSYRSSRFPHWRWQDFSKFNVAAEKPSTSYATVYAETGQPTDKSLFTWVVRNLAKEGWLTCDDGSGEIADFIWVDKHGVINLIHVKGHSGSTPRGSRGISVPNYEVVASQAEKSVARLNRAMLLNSLREPSRATRPTWHNGTRLVTDGRKQFSDVLANLPERAPKRLHIVQPSLRKSLYDDLVLDLETHPAHMPMGSDLVKLQQLETMLNVARTGALTWVEELLVHASDD
jgi:hypothetical protein